MAEYKIKIDHDLLSKFYLVDGTPTEAMIKEVDKVITVVLIKHYSSYASDPDLRSFALLAVLERRSRYDPSFSAYNYTYSAARNEIGNKIKKYGKEIFTDNMMQFNNRIASVDPEDLPPEVRRYCDYLTGATRFNFLRVPQSDVLNLLLFIKLYDSRSKTLPQVPDFVLDNEHSLALLYKLYNDHLLNGTKY